MSKGYIFKIPVLLVIATSIVFGAATAAEKHSQFSLIAEAESGMEFRTDFDNTPLSKAQSKESLITNAIPQDSVLLIPNVTNKSVGMYDPFDGDYLGILLTDAAHLATPMCAMQGPGGNIYVSDQISDGAFVYDTSGAYLFTFCDGTDGLNNIRGIDFRGDTLFLSSGDDYIAVFDAPHHRLADFASGGFEPYDIFFLDDGRALVADNGGDNVRIYNADGTFAREIFSVDFPIQIMYDDAAPGDYLNAAFLTANVITDFDLNGTIQQTTAWLYPRGVYRLGNGNLLATSNNTSHPGVYEIEPGTGNIIERKNSGDGFRFIELYVRESVGCDYIPGDVNGLNGYNGLDITYGVAYFTGGSLPVCPECPPCGDWYYCGDVNGSCTYNGLDITYGAAYFKGGPGPIFCADCPPNR